MYKGHRANMIHDKDGSLTGTNQETFIAPYNGQFNKLIADSICTNQTTIDNKYDTSVVCKTKVKAIKFGNLENLDLFKA